MPQQPCHNCPFRSDIATYIPAERYLTIGHAMQNDGSFDCHKTVHNESVRNSPCIGAISVLEEEGDALANVMVRLAAMSGRVRWPLRHEVPVYRSFRDAANAAE